MLTTNGKQKDHQQPEATHSLQSASGSFHQECFTVICSLVVSVSAGEDVFDGENKNVLLQ